MYFFLYYMDFGGSDYYRKKYFNFLMWFMYFFVMSVNFIVWIIFFKNVYFIFFFNSVYMMIYEVMIMKYFIFYEKIIYDIDIDFV